MTFDLLATAAARCLLVLLFLPFSALDKLLNFSGAARQAGEAVRSPLLARSLVLLGLGVEVVCSLAIVTGVADRLAALVLAGYCVATAVLWKRFWAQGDFRADASGRGRTLFWDFLKNLSLAGGLLLIALGAGVSGLVSAPFASSRPYDQPRGALEAPATPVNRTAIP